MDVSNISFVFVYFCMANGRVRRMMNSGFWKRRLWRLSLKISRIPDLQKIVGIRQHSYSYSVIFLKCDLYGVFYIYNQRVSWGNWCRCCGVVVQSRSAHCLCPSTQRSAARPLHASWYEAHEVLSTHALLIVVTVQCGSQACNVVCYCWNNTPELATHRAPPSLK